MNIEIKKIKKILDNAPEGATHWDKLQYYRIRYADSSLKVAWDVFNQGSGDFNSVGDTYLTDVYKIQSLSDLRQILALHEENEKLKSALNAAVRACYDVDSYGTRGLNSDYIKACEVLDSIEDLSDD